MKELYYSIKNNQAKRTWLIISLVLFVLLVILGFIAYKTILQFYSIKDNREVVIGEKQTGEERVELAERRIDGVMVPKGEENLYPVAIIFDNHLDARPSVSLAKANLVIEAEAEGGITRFLAFYASGDEMVKIGPIRSARPYYIDWASELGALFCHVGGSPEALVKIQKDKINDLNEFYNENYFWRQEGRFAPHNVLTSSEKLYKYLEENNLTYSDYEKWKFKEDKETPSVASSSQEIKIGYLLTDFAVNWQYDKTKNDYLRYSGGKLAKDEDGESLRAKNVVIQVVKSEVLDEELRQAMELVGIGEAILCQDGACERGSWNKEGKSERTKFYKNTLEDSRVKEEFGFNRGTTWIEVVDPSIKIEY